MKRMTFLQSAAALPLASVSCQKDRPSQPSTDGLCVYWGDLHTHCNISYGHGAMQWRDYCFDGLADSYLAKIQIFCWDRTLAKQTNR